MTIFIIGFIYTERTCLEKRRKKRRMEVGSSIVKTFKRFTIPRSTSSIGSFTTSNGTASNNEQKLEEITLPLNHQHPPLSYVQHYRSHHSQQNLTTSPIRPLSEDISLSMIRSASTNFPSSTNEYTTKKSKMDNNNNNRKSSIPRDISFDNLPNTFHDEENHKTVKINGQQRSSIKSLLTKKFQPLTTSTSINITTKQKKPRTSFKHFSQFLKRSHSTNTDLSTIATTNNQSMDLVYQSLQIKSNSNELDSNHALRLNTNSNNTALVSISEEENPLPIKQQNKSKIIDDNVVDDSNPNQSDQQHIPKIAPSLSKNKIF